MEISVTDGLSFKLRATIPVRTANGSEYVQADIHSRICNLDFSSGFSEAIDNCKVRIRCIYNADSGERIFLNQVNLNLLSDTVISSFIEAHSGIV